MRSSKSLNLIIFAIFLLLSGCATTPRTPAPVYEEADLANASAAQGNFGEAAIYWQQAAEVAVGPDRERFRLLAAESWLKAGENNQSMRVLDEVNNNLLVPGLRSRYNLLHAELALDAADVERAEFFLAAASLEQGSMDYERFSLLEDHLEQLKRDPERFALSQTAAALEQMASYQTEYGLALLQLLEDVSSGRLTSISQDNDEFLNNWPALALAIRNTLVSGTRIEVAAAQWATTYPDHAVTEDGFIELAHSYSDFYRMPSRVAVLLPTQGGLAAAGGAIRDGLISAYLSNQQAVDLRFYATNENPQSAVSAYFAALDDGAEWIIGPLRRQSVDALITLGGLSVPFLTLNEPLEQNNLKNPNGLFYSLSLSRELEARAAAERAIAEGYKAAMLLSSDNAWGQLMADAFSSAFTEAGGKISGQAAFNPDESDHSGLLTQLLQIDQSQTRKDRIQATLGVSLSFEPTRRDDFDMFFLAAAPVQGRQIRPLLRFHDAGSVPVFSSSRIFSGELNQTRDQDMNGIQFPTTQWHLTSPEERLQLSSARSGSMGSLIDLGSDAWNILRWLPLLQKDPGLHFPGRIGLLAMGAQSRVKRSPVWATFSRGVPVEKSPLTDR